MGDAMEVQRAPGVLFEVFDDRAVLLDQEGQELLTLNPVGTLIWKAIETPVEIDRLEAELFTQLEGVEREVFSRDLLAFVESLRSEGLIIVDGAPEPT
jgi:hypothetical protein